MAEARPVTAAVVVDRWPLVRIGMRRAVHEAGLQVSGEASGLGEGRQLLGRTGAGLIVVGDPDDAVTTALARAASAALVVLLVMQATREQLVELLGAGVAGIGLRSGAVADLADLVRRTLAGERAVAPALMAALVGGPAPAGPAPAAPAREVGDLTTQERRVLLALAAGSSNSQIAAELFLSPATVKTHLAHIYAKLDVGSRHEALSRAVALGLVH